jgi:acyl-CoA thioesterase-2
MNENDNRKTVTWQDLVDACGVTPIDDDRAVGGTGRGGEPRVGIFGGQMISKSLAACAHTVPEGSVPESMHVNLLSGGMNGDPVEFQVDRVRDGRNLQHREVRGHQDGKLIVQATVVAATPTEGLDWQLNPAPPVGPPDIGSGARDPWGEGLGWGIFEVAHRSTDEQEPPSHPVWLRCPLAVDADPWMHAAIYAFWSDFGPNWVIRVSHQAATGEPEEVFSVSATHSMWFHRFTPVDRWHLFDAGTHSIAHHQGMVHATLHDDEGRLNASVSQGIYIRA